MLRFLGFKATFNTSTNKQGNVGYFNSPGVSEVGVYRTNRNELFATVNYSNPPKTISPSTVTLPVSRPGSRQDISKSTGNLSQPLTVSNNIRKSAPDIPQVVLDTSTETQIKGRNTLEKQRLDEQKKSEKQRLDEQKKSEKQRLDEQKKLEKQRLDEQKKLEKQRLDEQKKSEKQRLDGQKLEKQRLDEQKKLEIQRLDEQKKQTKQAKEQEKVEKLRKEREKQTQKTKAEGKKTKRKAPQPQPQAVVQTIPETVTRSEGQESTNTRERSISTGSGPPPYTPPAQIMNNKSDTSGNTSFAVDESTRWDMISKHREQISRPPVVKSLPKQTHLDLLYKVGPTDATDSKA